MRRPIVPNIVGAGPAAIQQIKQWLMRLNEEANDVRRIVFHSPADTTIGSTSYGEGWPLLRNTQFLRLGLYSNYQGTGGDRILGRLQTSPTGTGSWTTALEIDYTPGSSEHIRKRTDTIVNEGAQYAEAGEYWRLFNITGADHNHVAFEILYADWPPRVRKS